MTSKKSLLTLTCAVFISLCSPIRTEMTWQERVARGANYGVCSSIPFIVLSLVIKRIGFNEDNTSELLSLVTYLLFGGIGIAFQRVTSEFGVDILFSESDRRELGKKRFMSNIAAGMGAGVGYYISGGNCLGSFAGATLFGTLTDYTLLDKKYNSELFKQLEKNTEENNKKRKEREATKINNKEYHDK